MDYLAIDPRIRRPVMPTRIVWQSGGVENAEILKSNNWGQALASDVPHCTLRGVGASILLDFGRELHGSLQLITGPTKGNKTPKLRLRFGESASEAMHEPNNDHAIHDLEIKVPPMGSQEFGLTGFRFARLDLLEEIELPLVGARAMTLMRDLKPVGSFQCSDGRLNRIWQVGADTVQLCMQDLLWDGPKRDRLAWIGDMHPEVAVISSVWGAHEIVPQSLDWVRDHTPLPGWMNGIASYSNWWVLIQRDWFMHHGNRAYLEAQRAYLLPLLDKLSAQVHEDGSLHLDGPLFLDWPSSENQPAVRVGLHALLLMTLRAGAELCAQLGEEKAKQKCEKFAALLEKIPPAIPSNSKQASALLALAGLHDAKKVNAQALAHEPLKGISTFYGYYVLQARAQAGDFAGALDVIRQYWGAMLDLGATSFWEDFDLAWAVNASRIDEIPQPGQSDLHLERGAYCYKSLRHSLCHGWAAGPTAWMSEHILGAQVLEPGCRAVRIAPHLGDLQWAEGDFPTPHGPIHIRHEKNAAGQIVSRIEAPEGIRIER